VGRETREREKERERRVCTNISGHNRASKIFWRRKPNGKLVMEEKV